MACSPPYVKPERLADRRANIPRLVNAQWLMCALRDNARATDRGHRLPWDAAQLYKRAAAFLELHHVRT